MPYKAFRELLAVAGLPEPDSDRLSIAGDDPFIKTPFRAGASAAAAQAAIGVAVDELWNLQTGRRQRIAVDVRTAAYGLRGISHVLVDGKQVKDQDPWFAFYPVRGGGWIRVHTNFPHHRDAVLEVLGGPADLAAAKRASAEWEGVALEDAIHAAGGAAALVRTREEWARHPQSAAIDALPLIDIVRIGDAPPEPLGRGERPLSGVRVLDLTRVLAGPTCGCILASHGADVLKINTPHLAGANSMGAALLDLEWETGFGKLSTVVDLRTPQGEATVRELLREADVFSQGYRPGSLAARGFSPYDVAKLRPGIVYVELSAWGAEGPWKGRRGFDQIVSAARGWSLLQGGGEHPESMPISANDYLSGYLMALGTLAALRRRATEGGSWLVRTSLARVASWIESQGLADPAQVAKLPAVPPESEIAALSFEVDSLVGRVRRLKPALELSETPSHWELPPAPVGHHAAIWP